MWPWLVTINKGRYDDSQLYTSVAIDHLLLPALSFIIAASDHGPIMNRLLDKNRCNILAGFFLNYSQCCCYSDYLLFISIYLFINNLVITDFLIRPYLLIRSLYSLPRDWFNYEWEPWMSSSYKLALVLKLLDMVFIDIG